MSKNISLYNDVPLTLEEVIDYCRALIFAMVQLEHPVARESLMFILWEKIDQLYSIFYQEKTEN